MSRSASFSTIETALSHIVVARLILEECELLIGSEYGVVIRAIPVETRSFEPILVPSLSFAEQLVDEAVMSQASTALQAQRSIEVYGTGFGKIALLRSLARQAELRQCYPHGILYLDQTDPIDDLLQIIFEQFYRVPSDVKPSRAEIRAGLSDRQALILLDHPALIPSELNQLEQFLPNGTFAIASIEPRFSQANCTIEISDPNVDLGILSAQENAVLELLATVGVSLKAEQISAIANVFCLELNRLIDLNLIRVEQERYKLWTNYQISEAWMEKVLSYVLDWVRTQPDDLIQERELLMATVQWSADRHRSSEVIEIVRSVERAFAIAKLCGSWSKLLRWSLAAAWALEDEAIEAWALHQLGTLAFCQQEVTAGYDTLRDASVLRTELNDRTAIAFSTHNLAQIKALIVPVKSQDSPRFYQRQFYWIVGLICAIAISVSIGAGMLQTHHQTLDHQDRSGRSHLD